MADGYEMMHTRRGGDIREFICGLCDKLVPSNQSEVRSDDQARPHRVRSQKRWMA
jgi:RNase P subunit RPR2